MIIDLPLFQKLIVVDFRKIIGVRKNEYKDLQSTTVGISSYDTSDAFVIAARRYVCG
jgi:hypothetical protein